MTTDVNPDGRLTNMVVKCLREDTQMQRKPSQNRNSEIKNAGPKSDVELVEAFRKGDHASFVELVDRYTQKAHNLALRITRNQEDAEEILQDVFVTVFNKIDKFEGKSAFSSWLYRITVNTSFMKLRKRKQTPAISLEDINPGVRENWVSKSVDSSDTNYISSRHELREALEKAISRLPGEYRIIFVLRDVDGLSNQEVGDILNLTVPAVKSRLHRSRLMLRKRLQKYYEDYMSLEQISYGPAIGQQFKFLEAA
jgi:RNA polymerase sigma-70 factor, ECF subfamily